jgi:hypothetical protein
MSTPASGQSTAEDFRRFLYDVRPRVATLFESLAVPKEEAGWWLSQVLIRLVFRWDQIRRRERWLLDTLKREIEKGREGSSKATPRP